MKSSSIILVYLLMVALIGCSSAEQKRVSPGAESNTGRIVTGLRRADKVASKGMELYSWKPSGEDWHFSLLTGTNRNKSLAEIMDTRNAIIGIENIKQKLSRLAVGESIFWNNAIVIDKDERAAWKNVSKEPVPKEMIHDLTRYCSNLKISLHGPWSAHL